MRRTIIHLTAIAALAAFCPAPDAHAASKEIIQLQTQVQTLQDMLQRLQQTSDSRLAVMQHLIEQTADSVNRMSQTMNGIQQQLQTQSENAVSGQQVSGQIQSLNDSVDELKSRIARLDKTLQDIQSQLQNINAQPAPTNPGQQPSPGPDGAAAMQQAPQAPPLDQLYQGGIRDYNSAKYDVAAGEFQDVLKYYPQDNLAGNAQFYLGEIAYRQGDYKSAIKNYDAVLEQFPGNAKAPAAQLRKAEAELALNQREAGIRDMRSLIQRYPQTPEAAQARSRLNGMGVRITASKPSAYR
ncbi:tetratricopeptide repeat protein [Pseudacidobacterium ailaaui]|jgi:tol-pal system protein YbgF|uniref:tetratricopeptide repeat protein n=1 Tax=Pseudacidobacterium ailaaui TaxID=1382359 RepID=UPI00047B73F2|nr:tetratricopeptide repeat protein [Pseudacidobacterium ailaaui]MBX6358618.1 tetratricopeptide repeat protein [Pseudacidobacterium ailaaui]MDI3254975.1 outer membrane protein assembly factor BamD [Bacillota bacterium]